MALPGLGEDGGLSGQLFQDLSGTGQTIAGLAHADVEAQFADLDLPHGVLGLCFGTHLQTGTKQENKINNRRLKI